MIPEEIAALGRAQTRGEDIRPPIPDYDPIAGVTEDDGLTDAERAETERRTSAWTYWSIADRIAVVRAGMGA